MSSKRDGNKQLCHQVKPSLWKQKYTVGKNHYKDTAGHICILTITIITCCTHKSVLPQH